MPDISCPTNQHIINSDLSYSCQNNVCLCDHGTGTFNCQNHLDEHCQSCDSGWTLNLDTSLCEKDPVCICEHGIAASGDACTENNAHICVKCYSPGYKIVNDQCQPKTCSCTDGTGENSGACLDENIENCAACNAGFHRQFSN